MKKLILLLLLIGLLCPYAECAVLSDSGVFSIPAVYNQPLFLDRLIHTAVKEIGLTLDTAVTASLQAGYVLTNNGEKDGVTSGVPNMEEMYPNLIKIPVVLEHMNIMALTLSGDSREFKDWGDFSGMRVGLLMSRVHILSSLPENAQPVEKENTRILFEGLIAGEYDVILYSKRETETILLPDGIVWCGQIDTMDEYLYVHEHNKNIVPALTDALRTLFADGRADKILNDIPMPEMYPKKTVLYITSTNNDIPREDTLKRTISGHFSEEDNIEWYCVELNSRRYSADSSRLDYIASIIRRDCASKYIAAIVLSGEDALAFVKNNYFTFFRGVPVLFSGVREDYGELIRDYEQYFTGFTESISAYETVQTAISLLPATRNIFVINDTSTKGNYYRGVMTRQLAPLADEVNITYSDTGVRFDELMTQIKELPQDSIVLIGAYFIDATDQYFTLSDMKRELQDECSVPIFSVYSTDLDYSAVGGKCLDYAMYGNDIAEMLKSVLNGASPMPVVTDTAGYSRWVFDYTLMRQWDIHKTALPEGAQIINNPPTIFEANPTFAVIMISLLILLVVVAVLVSAFVAKIRRQKEHLRTANELLAKDATIMQINESLQMLLDVLPIPIRIVDLESESIIYVNDAFVELFKYTSASDICGKKLIEIVPDFQNDGVAAVHKKKLTMSTHGSIAIEVDYVAADGSRIEALLISRHIEYRGKPASIGIIRDMASERRETELRQAALIAEQASRAKSTFIANMSHEIRTPMNSIVGFAELALAGSIPPHTRDYLIKIRESSNILLRIINDILDISKIESGKIDLEIIPFDIHEVFSACQTIISARATEKGIALYCYAEPSVGRTLLGDPTKLRQVLLNLLSNAVKFTNTGMVKLLAAIEEQTENSVTMRFEVKDSGIGMTSEQLDVIFDPFVQADESTTRRYGGTGLGLAITKNIIELMGGTLKVESTYGIGSKFRFSLTFQAISQDTVPAESKTVQQEKPSFAGEVLICEDNAMNREVICGHLANVGLSAVTAINGQEGVDTVYSRMKSGEKPFDLIFMDIHMPVMDGLEATQKLVEMGNQTPIVALTANVMASDRKLYREQGMADYLAKPFKMQELWACLEKYLPKVGSGIIEVSAKEEEVQRRKQKIHFTQDQKNTIPELEKALANGDIKLAVRLAHSLKGVAGLVGKTALQKAAAVVEQMLNEEGKADAKAMEDLKREHEEVLAEFALLEEKPPSIEVKVLDSARILSTLTELDGKLAVGDADSLKILDELRTVSGMETLVAQIEQYDFPEARKTLAGIKESLEDRQNENTDRG